MLDYPYGDEISLENTCERLLRNNNKFNVLCSSVPFFNFTMKKNDLNPRLNPTRYFIISHDSATV